MIELARMKLGKKAARLDPRTLKLGRYIKDLPAPPANVDYTAGITEWGMMLNDQLGDCTIAGCGHAEQVWSAAVGAEHTMPDGAILQKYEDWCGYNPSDPSTDQGGVEINVLNSWHKYGFWTHELLGYADPDPTNLQHVMNAIYIFGGVYIGVQLPVSVQGQPTWDVSSGPNAVPGSWGGHCVFVPKYRTDPTTGKVTFTCVTWGALLDITEAFWMYEDPQNGPYIDEVHALLAKDFIGRNGDTPAGLNLAALEARLAGVTS